jgi:WD40 repeat protein
VDCLQWLPVKDDSAFPGAMVLVSAGGDGVLRVWNVQAVGHLACTLQGAVGHLETVKDICVDENYERLVLGDSNGHVRMWDVSKLDTSSGKALSESFQQVHLLFVTIPSTILEFFGSSFLYNTVEKLTFFNKQSCNSCPSSSVLTISSTCEPYRCCISG